MQIISKQNEKKIYINNPHNHYISGRKFFNYKTYTITPPSQSIAFISKHDFHGLHIAHMRCAIALVRQYCRRPSFLPIAHKRIQNIVFQIH